MTSAGLPTQWSRPSRSSAIRSQYSDARFMSWVTATTVRPVLRPRDRIRSKVRNWWAMSREEVGSSSRITSGSCANALAINTLCLSPPLSASIRREARPRTSAAFMADRATARSLSDSKAKRPIWGFLPIRTASSTVMGKIHDVSWGTTATRRATSFRLILPGALPFSLISPSQGDRTPSIRLKSVDFPEPLGPRIPKNSPFATFRVTSPRTLLSSYLKPTRSSSRIRISQTDLFIR
ncbi:MAG: hypothetical protein PHI99_03095 [Syntrophales bacterium]|nr:hypothetical protein [Syntrophales bacterium]